MVIQEEDVVAHVMSSFLSHHRTEEETGIVHTVAEVDMIRPLVGSLLVSRVV